MEIDKQIAEKDTTYHVGLLFFRWTSNHDYSTRPHLNNFISFNFIIVSLIKHDRCVRNAVNKPTFIVIWIDGLRPLVHLLPTVGFLIGRLLCRRVVQSIISWRPCYVEVIHKMVKALLVRAGWCSASPTLCLLSLWCWLKVSTSFLDKLSEL